MTISYLIVATIFTGDGLFRRRRVVPDVRTPRRRTPDGGPPEQVFVVHLSLVADETVDGRRHRQRGHGDARGTATVVSVADDHHAAALGLHSPRQVAVQAVGDLGVLVTAGAANAASTETRPGPDGQQTAGGRGGDGHRRRQRRRCRRRRFGQREERQNRLEVRHSRFVVGRGCGSSRRGPGACVGAVSGAFDTDRVAETVALGQRRWQYELRTINRKAMVSCSRTKPNTGGTLLDVEIYF